MILKPQILIRIFNYEPLLKIILNFFNCTKNFLNPELVIWDVYLDSLLQNQKWKKKEFANPPKIYLFLLEILADWNRRRGRRRCRPSIIIRPPFQRPWTLRPEILQVRLILPVLQITNIVPHLRRIHLGFPPQSVGEPVMSISPIQIIKIPVHERPLLRIERPLQVVEMVEVHPFLEQPIRIETEVKLQVAAVHVKTHIALSKPVPQGAQRVDGALQVRVVRVVVQKHRSRLVEVQPSGAVFQTALQFNCNNAHGHHRNQPQKKPKKKTKTKTDRFWKKRALRVVAKTILTHTTLEKVGPRLSQHPTSRCAVRLKVVGGWNWNGGDKCYVTT